MNKNHFNERGYSLLITMLALVLLTILGLSILTVSGNTLKLTTNENMDQAAYYIAEAVVVEERTRIINIIEENSEEIESEIKNGKYDGIAITDEFIKNMLFNKLPATLEVTEAPFETRLNLNLPDGNSFTSINSNVTPQARYSIKIDKNLSEIEIKATGIIDKKSRDVLQKIYINQESLFSTKEAEAISPGSAFPIQRETASVIISSGGANPHPLNTVQNTSVVEDYKKWIQNPANYSNGNFKVYKNGLIVQNATLEGIIIVLSGDVDMTGNENTKFFGTIIAPNSLIKITANTEVCGTIIAKGYSSSGGGGATFTCNTKNLPPIENPLPKEYVINSKIWRTEPLREL